MSAYTTRVMQHGYTGSAIEAFDVWDFDLALSKARTLSAEYNGAENDEPSHRIEIYDGKREEVIYTVDSTGEADYR